MWTQHGLCFSNGRNERGERDTQKSWAIYQQSTPSASEERGQEGRFYYLKVML